MPNPTKPPSDTNRKLPQPSQPSSSSSDYEKKVSQNLWVGNLSTETKESDLMDLFGEYGEIDSVTNYCSRNFAFLHFKKLEDAQVAREGLQGVELRGNAMKIEYARPAKPGKHLWVGGISSNVTKEELEEEFLKFGKIEEYRFLSDRNTALIDYVRPEDAAAALKNLDGKLMGGEEIRVDYMRSQRRDLSDSNDSRDNHYNLKSMGHPELIWIPAESMWNFPGSSQFDYKRNQPSNKKEVGPNNTLWIHYPSTVQVDDRRLHNAMILYGEIVNIRSFPTKHYSFVEFRSVDEAERAKEGLQGRLFDDPRIQILFSNSGSQSHKDRQGNSRGLQGPGPTDYSGQHPIPIQNFGGYFGTNAMHGPRIQMRPPFAADPEIYNARRVIDFSDANHGIPFRPNRRRLSPSAVGLLPSPILPDMHPLRGGSAMRSLRDGSDTRKSKRSRMDSPSTPSRKLNRFQQQPDVDQRFYNPVRTRNPSEGLLGQGHPDSDTCWRGVIAKGGTPVCHARCVPLGNGLDTQLPEVVDCSARTGLDLLTKHYTAASDFDIVFFLPDSENDFASYTEFLRYLGDRNRAGVATIDSETTLFLVPPSDFLTKVLNVSGPERLYGVILKNQNSPPVLRSQPPPQLQEQRQPPQQSLAPLSRYNQPIQSLAPPLYNQPIQNNYAQLPQKEGQYNSMLAENPAHIFPKPPLLRREGSPIVQNVSRDNASALASQSGISLTPELIATLAALLPSNAQSTSTSTQIPTGSAPLPTSVTSDKTFPVQGWRQEQVISSSFVSNSREEPSVRHTSQQLGQQFVPQTLHSSQFPLDRSAINVSGHFSQPITQEPSLYVPQHGALSLGASSNTFSYPHGAQFTVPQQMNQQQYQFDTSQNHPQKSHGMVQHSNEAYYEFYRSSGDQPRPLIANPSAPSQGVNLPQSQPGMSVVNDRGNNTSYPDQMQQIQSAFSGASQGSVDGEAGKNERYQSTLQIAANLLLQIRQQEQQQQQR